MIECLTAQQALWDQQHARRGTNGKEANGMRFVPNESAVVFEKYLSASPSIIYEAGCANGRDARYWGTKGHIVVGMDFSEVALSQMDKLSKEQGIDERVIPYQHDIATGQFPPLFFKAHGFYARSALHVDDETMENLADNISLYTKPKGIILIEGKNEDDPKICRSLKVAPHLYADPKENMHVRRLWNESDMEDLAKRQKWDVVEVSKTVGESSFVRMIARNI